MKLTAYNICFRSDAGSLTCSYTFPSHLSVEEVRRIAAATLANGMEILMVTKCEQQPEQPEAEFEKGA